MSDKSPTSMVTPVFRASYAFVVEPRENDDGSETYGISCIFPKHGPHRFNKNDMEKMKKCAMAAATAKWGDKARTMVRTGRLHWPFRDSEEEEREDEAYQDSIFFNANAKRKPGIVRWDRSLESYVALEDPEENFYSGCWARAHVNFYTFERKGKKGVAVGLNHVLKVADGERLAGPSAGKAFEQVDPEELEVTSGDMDYENDDLGF